MKQKNRQIIERELKHIQEISEERRMFREAEERAYEIEVQKQKRIAERYLRENSPEICKKCYGACHLSNFPYECSYIGKTIISDLGEEEGYRIVDSPTGMWDKTFVPMTKEQINRFNLIC